MWNGLRLTIRSFGRLNPKPNWCIQGIMPYAGKGLSANIWFAKNFGVLCNASDSIIETAKENGLKPYNYLEYLFEQLPNADTSDESVIDSLLPWSQSLPESCRMPANQDNMAQD